MQSETTKNQIAEWHLDSVNRATKQRTMRNYVYKCEVCGSTNVEMKMWANPNDLHDIATNQDIPKNPSECYCLDCDDNIIIIYEPTS